MAPHPPPMDTLTLDISRPEPALAPETQPVAEPTARRSPLRVIMETVRALFVGLVAFLVVGNLLILAMHAGARTSAVPAPVSMVGVDKLQAIDANVWRGAAPSRLGYIELAASGVHTIVDLRAEANLEVDQELLDRLGMRLVRMPIRDGQVPTADQVATFMDAVRSSRGIVYVHCGAGVGRTGSMAAAYLVGTGQADGWTALRRNLAVGPPSLEQVAFAARLDGDSYARPKPMVVAVSRFLDAPRRLWSRFGF
jgi:protein tyrosine phosphatase (PTP) superfamily phosphohydrolase (DUF442 family)